MTQKWLKYNYHFCAVLRNENAMQIVITCKILVSSCQFNKRNNSLLLHFIVGCPRMGVSVKRSKNRVVRTPQSSHERIYVRFVQWYLKAEKLDVLYGCDSHWLCRDLISHMNVSVCCVCVSACVSIHSVVSALTLHVCLPRARSQRGEEWEG